MLWCVNCSVVVIVGHYHCCVVAQVIVGHYHCCVVVKVIVGHYHCCVVAQLIVGITFVVLWYE